MPILDTGEILTGKISKIKRVYSLIDVWGFTQITPINTNGCYELISSMHHCKDTLSATQEEAVALMKFLKSVLGKGNLEENLRKSLHVLSIK